MLNNNIGYRPTWAEVNLKNLDYNFLQIKKIVPPEVKVMVTVKADAYGHGLIPVSKRLMDCGVDCLGVASIDEGIKLRKENINLPILVLGLILESDIEPFFKYDLAATVCSEGLASVLNKKASASRKTINVHIKIDTGMGRIGIMHQDAFAVIKKIRAMKFLNIEGVFTHFAFADIDKNFTQHQIEIFSCLIKKLFNAGMQIPLVHAANSCGVLNYKKSYFNMVRPGLIVYGLCPEKPFAAKAGSSSVSGNIKLKPLLSLKTKVVFVKRVPAGYGISYGHIYKTKKNTTIVTLPIGYGDGYPRNLSNLGPVLIKGKKFKVSGRVCMDQIMVDVGDTPVEIGDEAVLIGSQGKNKNTTEELAALSGTIPYEIVCGLGSRIPRIYLD